MITKFKLFESPDRFNIYNNKGNRIQSLSVWDNDAVTFGYNDTEMLVSKKGSEIAHDEFNSRDELLFPGRLWIDHKIITFWKYPETYEHLLLVLKDIENTYNSEYLITIYEEEFDNNTMEFVSHVGEFNMIVKVENDSTDKLKIGKEWKIEIVVNTDGRLENPDTKYWNKKTLKKKNLKNIIIPIKDYKGSLQRSEEELNQQHILSPLKKNRNQLPVGIGSKNKKSNIVRKHYLGKFRGENLITNFKNFIK